ncbi:hypothetical protein ACFL27_19515 [candidate division CSSED10-310 bacterium]|uniref:Peptidase S54 rhomboid domain-containing protein n=1 Tax=candidate division CSSED10-310 bacterium TaxID=2855610 RepID=A0ABV6Z1R4_UNCC1
MKKYLIHNQFSIRFLAFFGLNLLLFTLVWYGAYHFLPVSSLHNQTGAQAAIQQLRHLPLVDIWLIIVIHNALGICIIIFFNLLLQVNEYPAGYLFPIFWAVYFGLLIGTNSFVLPMAERMAPSLAVFTRAGPYEITGYILIATASTSLSRIRMKRLFFSWPKFIIHPKSLTQDEWFGIGAGIILTLLSAWREVMMFQERLLQIH